MIIISHQISNWSRDVHASELLMQISGVPFISNTIIIHRHEIVIDLAVLEENNNSLHLWNLGKLTDQNEIAANASQFKEMHFDLTQEKIIEDFFFRGN